METFITDQLINFLWMGTTFSIFEMALIQKVKILPIFNKDYKIWLLNFFLSFLIGIPFTIHFFQVGVLDSIWVSLFGFIGSPSLYTALKNQKLINYTPQSSSASITIPTENEIKRK